MVNDKKIAGILIENINFKNNIKHTIVGIGLNINQIKFNNTLLHRKATSILLETKVENSIKEILHQLLDNLAKTYSKSKINPIEIFQKVLFARSRGWGCGCGSANVPSDLWAERRPSVLQSGQGPAVPSAPAGSPSMV